jgi:hypothetical protein
MREITDIIIHCADTPNGKAFHNTDIDAWHKERGFHRDQSYVQIYNSSCNHIGYHYVICIDGDMEAGRSPEEIGSHCQGHNAKSIGICLIGKNRYTREQWDTLAALLVQLKARYPDAVIRGHREYDTARIQGKLCPNFDVQQYVKNELRPEAGWML